MMSRNLAARLLSVLLVLAAGCTRARAPVLQAPPPVAAVEPDARAERLVQLLRARLALAPLVAQAKWNARLPIEDAAREASLLADLRASGAERGLPADWVATFFRAQIETGKRVQQALIDRWTAASSPPFPGAPDLRADLRPKIDAVNRAILDLLVELVPRLREPAVQAAFRPRHLQSADVDEGIAARALAPLVR